MRAHQRRTRARRLSGGKTGNSRSARHHSVGQPGNQSLRSRNNRLRVIEGGELKHLLAEHLALDVRIDLARRPRRAT